MDSFLSSSSVSQEEFNIFHRVDRLLYRRLVIDLRRDPAHSSQVMALWMWLEHTLFYFRGSGYDLISKYVIALPETLLIAFANESEAVLSCVETDHFPFASSIIPNTTGATLRPRAPALPMFEMLIDCTASLEVFYKIRLRVIWGVADMSNRVCARAFTDIIAEVTERKMVENMAMSEAIEAMYGGGVGRRWLNNMNRMMMMMPPAGFAYRSLDIPSSFPAGLFQSRGYPYQHRSMVPSVDDFVMPTRPAANADDDPDLRTIFLTFSKGYPISEKDVKLFFTSVGGEGSIEDVHMQHRSGEEQSLFARLVLRSASDMEAVLQGKEKVKFSIDGKHVWARKYEILPFALMVLVGLVSHSWSSSSCGGVDCLALVCLSKAFSLCNELGSLLDDIAMRHP
uniref:RRM domain-containing protein n=1 Tax=Cannabis sativa TaxID=3483 RepID=A0A803P1Z6_CANSA